ncbi:MAG TPA: hypothetical protein VFU06_14470 [Longimicrobiales bacterium]|nr:hypothetical protein [Longimicrobiales bacterium]
MKTNQWVASADFVLVRPDGTRSPVHVGIAAPEPAGAGEWSCGVSLAGLYEELPPVSGTDSLQALGLAWRLAGLLLASVEAAGGHLEFDNGEVVPLSAYFDDPLRPPAVPDQAI